MVDIQQFETIKQKHGSYASWAVWADSSGKPKSNMGVVSHFENESVLNLLKNDVVMVGLNCSRLGASEPFTNFHDANPRANDFKIRYAFRDSPYYGAYMTDIIKSHEEVDSKKMMQHLKANPGCVADHVEHFREELRDLRATTPLLLAFGHDTYKLLYKNLNRSEYRKLVRLTHYSHRISKEKYTETVFKEIAADRQGHA